MQISATLYVERNVCVDGHLHCHIITKADVKKAIHKLKLMRVVFYFQIICIKGTDLLYLFYICKLIQ